MKKIAFCLMIICLSLTFQSKATTTTVTSPLVVAKSIDSAEVKALLSLNKIKAKDKSNLTSSEKNNLQMEHHHHRRGGLYISLGGVILIVLLVVILLR